MLLSKKGRAILNKHNKEQWKNVVDYQDVNNTAILSVPWTHNSVTEDNKTFRQLILQMKTTCLLFKITNAFKFMQLFIRYKSNL